MLSRLVMSGGSLSRSALQMAPIRTQFSRQLQRDSRESLFRTRGERIAERQTLKERAMAPPGPNGKCMLWMPQSAELNESS